MSSQHHSAGERKNFRDYFFEFVMVFLAVTLGFFAENLRESHTERDEEQQYAKFFDEDLASDEKALPELLVSLQRHIATAAELQLSLPVATTTSDATKIYVDFRHLIRQLGIHLYVSDRTLAQVRNSGGMRLLRNRQVTDGILDYYRDVDLIASLQEVSLQQERSLRDSFAPLLDGRQWDEVIDSGTDNIITSKVALHLRSTDPETMNNCLLWISDLKGIHNGFRGEVVDLRKKATSLRRLITQSYRIKKKGSHGTSDSPLVLLYVTHV